MVATSPFDLTGKVAIVTGSTKGIGRAMATGLSHAGATVVISSRKQDLCDEVAEKIAPSFSSLPRSSRANGRLPLWQTAIWPCWQVTRKGWASRIDTSPAVE